MDFRILGPVEVFADSGEPVVLSQRLQRRLVAELVLHARQPLSRPDLITALWGDDPPSGNGGMALRSLVHATRRAFRQHAERLVTWPAGYVLEVSDDESDLAAFRDLAQRGQSALDCGDPGSAASLLAEALHLWRQPQLSDLADTAARARLLDQVRSVRADLTDARLALGQYRNVLPDLRAVIAEDPWHEHSWAQMMIALYRAGSRAEALACYRQIHKMLATEHGIDPGPELRDLHARILRDDPSLLPRTSQAAPAWTWVPLRQLPRSLQDFTGRRTETVNLLSELSAATPLIVLSGMAGMGTTALAVHAAQLAVPSFPDGQIWIELGGCEAPRDPQEVLGQLLVWALGRPQESLPPPGPERAALYRSLLAGRRILVVADGATSASQVRTLLPGTEGSCLLATTRSRLHLDGARVVSLVGMPAADAVSLLAVTAGPDRVRAEPEAARSVVASCGYLPLAVRIAGWQLATGQRQTVSELAAVLADPDRCLSELTFRDQSVSARLEASMRRLDTVVREALGVLAAAAAPEADLQAETISVMLGGDGRWATAQLADAGLLAESHPADGPAVYRLHPLVQALARQALDRDGPPGQPHAAAVLPGAAG